MRCLSTRGGRWLNRLRPGGHWAADELRPEHCRQHGFAHGGGVSCLEDNALTCAGGSVSGDSPTLEEKINYLRPAKVRRLVARVTGSGRSQAVCHCDVFVLDEAGEEKLCATAQGTIRKVG